MADDRPEVAIDVVARSVLHHRAQDPEVHVDHADYDDLSTEQWAQVEVRIKVIVERLRPSVGDFEAAYDFLKEHHDG